ncbi:MAG: type VI secretion system baseplate subunit TssF, partial [Phycisphaerae bacterium]
AEANPDIAPQLRIDENGSQDPYVERLIEAFAYINARTRKKLDDDFPEIAEAMLGIVFPQYLAPFPSVAIAEFELDRTLVDLFEGYPVPRGSRVDTEEVDDEACRFRTCYDLRLLPIEVAEADWVLVQNAPRCAAAQDCDYALRIRLTTFGKGKPLGKVDFGLLRFYLAGRDVYANKVYELMLARTREIVVDGGEDARWSVDVRALTPGGFAPEDAVLPLDARTFRGHAMLAEYFALPEKFRFVDFDGFTGGRAAALDSTVDLYFFIPDVPEELHGNVNADMFRLNCTPIVNLFEKGAEPIYLDNTETTYPIIPDARRPEAFEIYSVDALSIAINEEAPEPVFPFYSTAHAREAEKRTRFFHARRRATGYVDGKYDPGTEIDLTLVDLRFSPTAVADSTLTARLTCLNRDLPGRLPYSSDRPRLRVPAGGPIGALVCLTKPTPTRRPPLEHANLWRLVSFLSLNQLTVTGDEDGAAALRESLQLFDHLASRDHANKVKSLVGVTARPTTDWLLVEGAGGFGRGTEVTVRFDQTRFADNGFFLFANVLEQYLASSCSINSFTKLVARSSENDDELHRWPPRAGRLRLI